MRFMALGALLLLAWAVPGIAHAATRTVCFNLVFVEGRDGSGRESPTSTEPGNIRGRHAEGSPTPAVGHLFELWDKDNDGTDEYIGRYIKSTDGWGCATFEWEGSTAYDGETHPDVWVRYINVVRDTALAGDKVRAVDEAGDFYPHTHWRDGPAGDPDKYVAKDCTPAGPCNILSPGISLAIHSSITTLKAGRINALDTAQRTLEQFSGQFDWTGEIRMYYPCVDGVTLPQCPDANGFMTTADLSEFAIVSQVAAMNGGTAAHELGHLLMNMQLGRDDLLSGDFTLGGDDWDRHLPEFESAAVYEGWADYVAAVSWWDAWDAASRPRVDGRDLEAATPLITSSCSANSGIPFQVAKGFWDLADANNEGPGSPALSADTYTTDPRTLSTGWIWFNAGNNNREDDEPRSPPMGSGDPDGRNLRDYFHNNSWYHGPGFFTTLMNHNCTGSQDDG